MRTAAESAFNSLSGLSVADCKKEVGRSGSKSFATTLLVLTADMAAQVEITHKRLSLFHMGVCLYEI
eukprot:m.121501 g.121501  ORF g.121501 m.121501 type:complete len:67 (+) comp28860_c0_seq1:2551-2751(+)